MSSTLANKARTTLLTFIHSESLCNLKHSPLIKINGRSPTEMLRNFENIEITINNPIETGFASRSGRMISSYRQLNDIIIHNEEEEVDESFIDEESFILKPKTIVSEKKMHKKEYTQSKSLTQTKSGDNKSSKYHKSKSLSDSGELTIKNNVDYIKHSYTLLRKLSHLLKKKTVSKSQSIEKNKDKQQLTQDNVNSTSTNSNNTTKNNNNKSTQSILHKKKFSPMLPCSSSKQNDFRINLQKTSSNNPYQQHAHFTSHSSVQTSSLVEPCESSSLKQNKMKSKHQSHTNLNLTTKMKHSPFISKKTPKE